MTRQEALDYDDELKSRLALEAEILGLEESTGSSIVDNYIMVIPDDARKGMVFLGNEAISYKFGNISMDFKKAIAAGIELVASISRPESFFNYVQLLITGVLFIQKAAKQEIGKNEAYIVYYLHIRNGYATGIEEESFINDFSNWYKEKNKNVLDPAEIGIAIENLSHWKIIAIDGGKIWLKETVMGVMEP